MVALVVILSSLLLVIAFWVAHRRARQIPAGLQTRPNLSLHEIQHQFYPDVDIPADKFAALWQDVATAFQVPAGRVRPTDKFGGDLPFRPVLGATDEDVFLALALRKRCKEFGIAQKEPVLKTVDDYIRFFTARG